MEAFYNQKISSDRQLINYDLLPSGFYTNIKAIVDSELKAVIVGAKTIDEAIASMQERGQQLLDQK
ncbi:hypothetical protein D3C81_1303340 [compost metagenome]